MQIKALKVFCDVVEQGSFSKAGTINGVSQSAASQLVNHVESQFGVKFIDRSSRPIRMFPAGEIFYERTRGIVDQFESLQKSLNKFIQEDLAVVKISSICSAGLGQIQQIIDNFKANFPNTEVKIKYAQPDEVYSLVEDFGTHLGIVSYPRSCPSCQTTVWRDEEMIIVCSPEHPFASRKSLKLTELNGEAFVGYDKQLPINEAVSKALRQATSKPDIVVRFDTLEVMKRAIEVNTGIGLLPKPEIANEVTRKTLVGIPIEGTRLTRTLGIVTRNGWELPASAKNFFEFLINVSAEPSVADPMRNDTQLNRAKGHPAVVSSDENSAVQTASERVV